MHSDQHRPVVTALNIPRVELRRKHGVNRLEGRTKVAYCAQNRYLILGQLPDSKANNRRFMRTPPGAE
jgi:hypothetical protein